MTEHEPDERSFSQAFDSALEAVGELTRLHIELFKVEATRDLKRHVRAMVPLLAAAVLLSIAYLLLVLAASIALGEQLGEAAGFALVGAAHIGGAAVAALVGERRLHTKRAAMASAGQEVARSARDLMAAIGPPTVAGGVPNVR